MLPGSSDWKAVPDIWRTAAEKFADRIAMIDSYHEPPLELTYKQVNFSSVYKYFNTIYLFISLFIHKPIHQFSSLYSIYCVEFFFLCV